MTRVRTNVIHHLFMDQYSVYNCVCIYLLYIHILVHVCLKKMYVKKISQIVFTKLCVFKVQETYDYNI